MQTLPELVKFNSTMFFLSKLFPQSRFFGREHYTWWNYDSIREIEYVEGCFFLIRSELISKIGFLDEQFFLYGEEADWCFRTANNGWKVLFTPDAEIIHYVGESTKHISTSMIMQLWGSYLLFIMKNHSMIQYYMSCIVICMYFSIRIIPWFVLLFHNCPVKIETVVPVYI